MPWQRRSFQGGYEIGPDLPAGEAPWPPGWESELQACDHAVWESVTVRQGGLDEVVRCQACHVPRCGHVHDQDPCMLRRHHPGEHWPRSAIEALRG